jgi:YYY domain-containing protein
VYGWLWESTRVVGGHFTPASWSCNRSALAQTNDYTINEYPLFSFVLGDLHPHLTALPGTLLALAFGCNMLFRPRVLRVQWNRESVGSLALMSIAVGALFTMNSWDFPTYLLILAACIAMSAYITNSTADWWKEPAQTVALLAAASLVLFAPFYIHFRSLAHGVGRVTTPTNIYEFIQVFGLYLLGAALLIGALHVLLRPAVEEGAEEETAVPKGAVAAKSERGATDLQIAWVIGAVTAIIVLGGVLQRWVLLLDLGLASWALTVLYRVLNTERPNRSDALTLTLVAVAALVLAFTELFYLRDVFDGSSSYRMNTVFKFYYQAWTLLSLAAAYGSYRGWRVLRDYFSRSLAWGALVVLAVGVVGAGIYTRYVPAYAASSPASRSLNGIAWLRANHPDDDAAIQWLRSHASGDPVVLEAPGDEYAADTSRIATFSGLPTVIGWSGHENQWRPGDGDIGVRVRDVNTIYSTTNVALAEQLMRRYGVGYVVVGDFERACPTTKSHCYPRAGLAKFHRFMRAAYTSGTTTVFRW